MLVTKFQLMNIDPNLTKLKYYMLDMEKLLLYHNLYQLCFSLNIL